MLPIIDKVSLFNGTTFPPMLQNAIYEDILDTRCFFPEIYPYRYMYPDHAAVLLQGTVQIIINDEECALPLSMAIPPNYPNNPPITQIAVKPGFPIITSECLQPNGLVLTQFFYKWVPRVSTLAKFINEIVKYFSMKPPFSLKDAKRLIPNKMDSDSGQDNKKQQTVNSYSYSEIQEQAIVEAISLLESINSDIKKYEDQYADDVLTSDMANTIGTIYNDMKNIIKENQEKLDALESQQLPDVSIDPQLEHIVEMNSKNIAFQNTKDELQDWFENGIISLDDFLQAIRDLSRDHFQNDIVPSLS